MNLICNCYMFFWSFWSFCTREATKLENTAVVSKNRLFFPACPPTIRFSSYLEQICFSNLVHVLRKMVLICNCCSFRAFFALERVLVQNLKNSASTSKNRLFSQLGSQVHFNIEQTIIFWYGTGNFHLVDFVAIDSLGFSFLDIDIVFVGTSTTSTTSSI